MANMNVLNEINSTGQADTSLVLDTLMYANDYINDSNYSGLTVKQLCDVLETKIDPKDASALAAVENVKTYINNHPGSEVENLKLSSSSASMGDDYKGARAATFYSDNSGSKDVYVAFMGTGDGRWYDNGDAFGKTYSEYQQQAAMYFDKAVDILNVDSSCNVIATGHSKGGNMAQFIALGSSNADLIDRVISYDGQGFSPEAIEYFKKLYGEDFYRKQCDKMYSVCGDNDFVNVLGIKVIPDDHTIYIKTATGDTDFPNSHALYDEKNGNKANFFDYTGDGFYECTLERRNFSRAAQELSEYAMSLPQEEREALCRSIMTALEVAMPGGTANLLTGLDGQKADITEIIEALTHLDEIVDKLLRSESVRDLIDKATDYIIKKVDDKIFGLPLPYPVCLVVSVIAHAGIKAGVVLLELLVESLARKISKLAKVAKTLIRVFEICKKGLDALRKAAKWLSSSYRAAVRYIADHRQICCDTSELSGLADRVSAVNGRLSNLDRAIDDLYSKVKWTDLLTLQRADFKICYSSTLKKCADYLYDTSRRFEQAESKVLEMFG